MQKDEQTGQQGQKDKYWGWWNIIAFSCGTNAALLKNKILLSLTNSVKSDTVVGTRSSFTITKTENQAFI